MRVRVGITPLNTLLLCDTARDSARAFGGMDQMLMIFQQASSCWMSSTLPPAIGGHQQARYMLIYAGLLPAAGGDMMMMCACRSSSPRGCYRLMGYYHNIGSTTC